MNVDKVEKGLECCADITNCENCPYNDCGCKEQLHIEALDCIKRLEGIRQDYISHLKEENEHYLSQIRKNNYDTEIKNIMGRINK